MLLVSTVRGSGRTTKQLIFAGGLVAAGKNVRWAAISYDAACEHARYFHDLFPESVHLSKGHITLRGGSIIFASKDSVHARPTVLSGNDVLIEDHAVTEAHPSSLLTKCHF